MARSLRSVVLLSFFAAAFLFLAPPSEAQTYCPDDDLDGWGVRIPANCDPDTLELFGDCDDQDPNVNPGATEICDGIDNDCDGDTDEGFDNDGDGVTTCADDCDDNDPKVAPGLPELCGDLLDNDCDGTTEEGFVVGRESGFPPDPANPASRYDCNDGLDNDADGATDLADANCQAAQCFLTDPANCCAGNNQPPGRGCTAPDPGGCCLTLAFRQCDTQKPAGTPICAEPTGGELFQQPEGPVGAPSCSDAKDNDCDGFEDLAESECQAPEVCNGLDDDATGREGPNSSAFDCLDTIDNDDDGFTDIADPGCLAGVDDDPGFVLGTIPLGGTCVAGIGACERSGQVICDGMGGVTCSRSPGNPGTEGPPGSAKCFDDVDNDCDGETDFPADEGCRAAELCNGLDDDGDGVTDEGFSGLGEICSAGQGACLTEGSVVCSVSGNGTACNAVPGLASQEGPTGDTCVDKIDNDCDGDIDTDDSNCGSAGLMVECALAPVQTSRPNECSDTSEIRIRVMGESSTDTAIVTAELLALDFDGNVLAALPVEAGDWARMASRTNPSAFRARTREMGTHNQRPGARQRVPRPDRIHEVFAPIPLLRVTVHDGSNEAVAYCSNVPYMQVVTPDNEVQTAGLSDVTHVQAAMPLIGQDTLEVHVDGVEVLRQLMPFGDFFCPKVKPCGGTALVGNREVQISNLIIETRGAATFSTNTLTMDVSGLGCGAHTITAMGTERDDSFPTEPSRRCIQDDMLDTGEWGVFEISLTSPVSGTAGNPVPTPVTGQVCHGRPIAALSVNGMPLDPSIQQAITLDPGTPFERTTYVLPIDTFLGQTDLARDLKFGDVALGSFDAGSNRAIVDAQDDFGNRAFETRIFATGSVGNPGTPAATMRLPGTLSATPDGVAGTSLGTSARAKHPTALVQDPALPGAEVEFDFPGEEGDGTDPDVAAQWKAALEGSMRGEYDADLKAAFDESFGVIMPEAATPGVEIDNAFVVGIKASAIQKVFQAKCARAAVQFRDRVRSRILSKPPTVKQVSVPCACDPWITIAPTSVSINAADFTCPVTFSDNQFTVSINLPDVRIFTSVSGSCTDRDPIFGACITRSVVTGFVETQLNNVFMRFNVTESQLMGNPNPQVPFFDPGGALNIDANASLDVQCIGGDICEGLVTIFTFGLVDISPDINVSADVNFTNEMGSSQPDPIELEEVKIDEATIMQFDQEAEGRLSSVEITANGIVAGLKGRFKTSRVDPSVVNAPGTVLTSNTTLPSALAPGTGDVYLAISDDVFNMLFASMRIAGKLNSGCRDSGRTVGDILPFDCTTLTAASPGGTAAVQGLCHGIRGDDCEMFASGDPFKTPLLQGICHGTQGDLCTGIPRGLFGTAWPSDCETVTFSVPGGDPNGNTGPDQATAILQGVCHGSAGDDCETLAGADADLTAIEQGACHAAQGTGCAGLPGPLATAGKEKGSCAGVSGNQCALVPFGQKASCSSAKIIADAADAIFDFEERKACEVTPARNINIGAADPLLFCTTTDMPPRLLIQDDASTSQVVETGIRLNDLSVAMLVDRNATTSPGLDGALSATPGCFDPGAPTTGDCLLFGVCLDLNFVTDMRFDNQVCAVGKPGLKTTVKNLQTTVRQEGVVCGAPTATADNLLTSAGATSSTIDILKQNVDMFTPPSCANGFDLSENLQFGPATFKLVSIDTDPASDPGNTLQEYIAITGLIAP